MKRYGNLWDKIVTFPALLEAFDRAKRRKHDKIGVIKYNFNMEDRLFDLKERLENGTWKPGPVNVFMEYGVKIREIHAPYFEDRIVHHALVSVINPIFDKSFVHESYACRIGKGNINAMKELHSKMRSMHAKVGPYYFLKADIKKYFNNINHEILFNILKRKIKDKKVLDLCWKIIHPKEDENVGLPIGALTSQLFANIYLNELDYYIKRTLKCKYYIRYMDDFVILEKSKRRLHLILKCIELYCKKYLQLELNPKTNIDHVKNGINFVGYRLKISHRTLRKNNRINFKKNLKKYKYYYKIGKFTAEDVTRRIKSLVGFSKHCSSDTFRRYAFASIKFIKGQ